MAAITLTLANAPRDMGATTRRYLPTVTGPTLYVAGGDTGLKDALGIGKIFAVLGGISNGTNILIPFWDNATGKLQWYDNSTGAEAAGDLSTYSGVLEVIGQ